jgi:hypothetical protein
MCLNVVDRLALLTDDGGHEHIGSPVKIDMRNVRLA